MKRNMMMGAVLFIATFLVLAMFTPVASDELPMTDPEIPTSTPGWIRVRMELTDGSGTVVWKTHTGGRKMLLSAMFYTETSVSATHIRAVGSWVCPIREGHIWTELEVLRRWEYEDSVGTRTTIRQRTSAEPNGDYAFAENALEVWYDPLNTTGPQTVIFRNYIKVTGIWDDGQKYFFHCVGIFPITLTHDPVADLSIFDTMTQESLGWLTSTLDESINWDELTLDQILEYLATYQGTSMSLFGNEDDGGMGAVQKTLLIAGVVTVGLIIVNEKGRDTLDNIWKQIRKGKLPRIKI